MHLARTNMQLNPYYYSSEYQLWILINVQKTWTSCLTTSNVKICNIWPQFNVAQLGEFLMSPVWRVDFLISPVLPSFLPSLLRAVCFLVGAGVFNGPRTVRRRSLHQAIHALRREHQVPLVFGLSCCVLHINTSVVAGRCSIERCADCISSWLHQRFLVIFQRFDEKSALVL
jgi:hypothetical protein